MRRQQAITLAVMVVGYTGYYACRSNFSVALPLLVDELSSQGWSASAARTRLGEIASLGVLAYALGKFVSGTWTDVVGGRRAFFAGMALSCGFTVAFAASATVPLFTVAWIGNRLVQSSGWVGTVRLTSRWFGYAAYARAMAVVSMSFLFGDALVRWAMGSLLAAGLGWRSLFLAAAGTLATIAAASAWLLRDSPTERDLPEPPPHPENLFRHRSDDAPVSVAELWRTLARSPAFGAVCAISFALTLLRETFNTWTPTFFVEHAGLSVEAAARWSALFPLSGGIAVLGAGWLGDRIGRDGRARLMIAGQAAAAGGLLLLGWSATGPAATVALVGAIGFSMLAPYSYLAGAISLDFGGRAGSAAACGIIDGVGYLGGVLAGGGVARLASSLGWGGALSSLSAMAVFGVLASVVYLRLLPRSASPASDST